MAPNGIGLMPTLLVNMAPGELKSARLRLGFRSRRALAEALGVTKWAVDSWEMGRRPVPSWVPRFLDCLAGKIISDPPA